MAEVVQTDQAGAEAPDDLARGPAACPMRLAALFLLLAATGASAQPAGAPTAEPPRPSWFSFAVGASSGRASSGRASSGLGGVGVHIVAPVGAGPFVVRAGASGAQELGFFVRSGDDVFEGHVGAGVSGQTGPLHVAVTAGPSVTRVSLAEFDDSLGYRRRVGRTGRVLPGAYASVQGVVAVSRSLGLSAEAFGLANADLPTVGGRVGIAVGGF